MLNRESNTTLLLVDSNHHAVVREGASRKKQTNATIANASPSVETAPVDTLSMEYIPFYQFDTSVQTTPVQDTNLLCLDSVLAHIEHPEPVVKKSLFKGHKLQASSLNTTPHVVHGSPGWLFGSIIVLVALISWFVNSYRFRIRDIFSAAFSVRGLNFLFRENNFTRELSLLPMSLFYFGGLAFYFFFWAQWAGVKVGGGQDWLLFLSLLGASVVFYLTRSALIRLLGSIFENSSATSLYMSNTYIYSFVGTLFVVPISLILFYAPRFQFFLAILLGVIVAILFVMRLVRGMNIMLKQTKNSRLYLFYYLCILEIVPILIAVKLISSW